ncbi:murein L,D-transpeptidase catalytic domain family protein [Prosthecochloris sp.]|uniref:murein L,D-transpeptidase catalytic domain family protein n=1 Tax=Prosthecochloris sp. TaxID=290513 RepID=UPI0025CDE056|nr:murein L,D-transpeptidase catalytic domain family protein [Prosthecochloris sp.]
MTRKTQLIAFGFATVLLSTVILFGLLFSLPAVSDEAIQSAYRAVSQYRSTHPHDSAPQYLAIVDYTKPSLFKRMLIIDTSFESKSFYHVAHAAKSGTLKARKFSNISGSNMSSLGLYKTGNVYKGDHGLAIRLHGLDSLKNSNAFKRDIVFHSASYVSIPVIFENLLTFNGPRIGRSNGCFVVNPAKIQQVVDTLGRGGFVYAHGEAETNEK